ncbi:hypothetical protein J2Z66_002599 [Paenibacillus eucommiae]|uniref:Uncharacterized protein n=1 Tax=Paenibacillus eucommiae TaxID=1355755 RepID=A0ABS4ITU2_9BACL|nr:hypothetical protein [Paenibacillus eucommiae]
MVLNIQKRKDPAMELEAYGEEIRTKLVLFVNFFTTLEFVNC